MTPWHPVDRRRKSTCTQQRPTRGRRVRPPQIRGTPARRAHTFRGAGTLKARARTHTNTHSEHSTAQPSSARAQSNPSNPSFPLALQAFRCRRPARLAGLSRSARPCTTRAAALVPPRPLGAFGVPRRRTWRCTTARPSPRPPRPRSRRFRRAPEWRRRPTARSARARAPSPRAPRARSRATTATVCRGRRAAISLRER
jgi:hypothetical protein